MANGITVFPQHLHNFFVHVILNRLLSAGAGGGRVSIQWEFPDWQKNISGKASTIMRNVPVVSLNSDQYTGYFIYYKRKWYIFGGTSCASPLWAAFNACVNPLRSSPLGFANPAI
jgi:subtilase family serine protease